MCRARSDASLGSPWVALLSATAVSCQKRVSVTFCSNATDPIELVIRFTRADPDTLLGVAGPKERTTFSARPLGDGHYSIELRRAGIVRTYELGYTTTEGGHDTYTIGNDLGLTEGCSL